VSTEGFFDKEDIVDALIASSRRQSFAESAAPAKSYLKEEVLTCFA
jgi:hypothetical protein